LNEMGGVYVAFLRDGNACQFVRSSHIGPQKAGHVRSVKKIRTRGYLQIKPTTVGNKYYK